MVKLIIQLMDWDWSQNVFLRTYTHKKNFFSPSIHFCANIVQRRLLPRKVILASYALNMIIPHSKNWTTLVRARRDLNPRPDA